MLVRFKTMDGLLSKEMEFIPDNRRASTLYRSICSKPVWVEEGDDLTLETPDRRSYTFRGVIEELSNGAIAHIFEEEIE